MNKKVVEGVFLFAGLLTGLMGLTSLTVFFVGTAIFSEIESR